MKKIIQNIIVLLLLISPATSFAAISNVLTYNPVFNVSANPEYSSVTFFGSGNTGNDPKFWIFPQTGSNVGLGYFRYSKRDIPPIFCNDLYGSDMRSTKESWLSGSNANFQETVADLEPNTTYYYCAVISNDAKSPTDIAYGGVKKFITPPCSICQQILITTKPGLVAGPAKAYLNGEYNATKASRTYFEYKKDVVTTPPQDWVQVNKQTHGAGSYGDLNYLLTGLLPSTPYKFRAIIEERKDNSLCTTQNPAPCYENPVYGGEESFTTMPPAVNTVVNTNPGSGIGNNIGSWGNLLSGLLGTTGPGSTLNTSNNGTGSTGGPGTGLANCDKLKVEDIEDQETYVNQRMTFNASICGGYDDDTIQYFADNLPLNARFSPNGFFEWTPNENQVGEYLVKIYAKAHVANMDDALNSRGAFNYTTNTIAVKIKVFADPVDLDSQNSTLTIAPISNKFVAAESKLAFTAHAYNRNNKTVTFSSLNTPFGASFVENGSFEWKPTIEQIGSYTFTINARTSEKSARPLTIKITVTDRNANLYYYDPQSPYCNPASDLYNPTSPICNPNSPINPFGNVIQLPFTGSGTIGGNIFGPAIGSGNGNGNVFDPNSSNNYTITRPPRIGDEAIPLPEAIVHYHEGIETVFTRQIMKYPGFAKLYGYQDGQDLQNFADNLSHTFAQMFGYYTGGGREIRVIIPDIAAYEFGLKNGMLAIYEYYDGFLTGISVVTTKLKDAFEYEYYYTKR